MSINRFSSAKAGLIKNFHQCDRGASLPNRVWASVWNDSRAKCQSS